MIDLELASSQTLSDCSTMYEKAKNRKTSFWLKRRHDKCTRKGKTSNHFLLNLLEKSTISVPKHTITMKWNRCKSDTPGGKFDTNQYYGAHCLFSKDAHTDAMHEDQLSWYTAQQIILLYIEFAVLLHERDIGLMMVGSISILSIVDAVWGPEALWNTSGQTDFWAYH